MIKEVTKEKLLKLEVLTMDKAVFEQIERPHIVNLEETRQRAETEAVALVLRPSEWEDDAQTAWLICQGEHRPWRWELGGARLLSGPESAEKYPWLVALPQVFLRGAKRKR